MAQIQSLIFIFFFFIMIAHLAACLWVYMGFLDRDLPPEARESWIYVNELYGSDADGNANKGTNGDLYIFALYWVFTTLTTVGYGDYAGGTTAEYLVTLAYEFVGFCYNAVLISVMSSFFASEATFDDLLDALVQDRHGGGRRRAADGAGGGRRRGCPDKDGLIEDNVEGAARPSACW